MVTLIVISVYEYSNHEHYSDIRFIRGKHEKNDFLLSETLIIK